MNISTFELPHPVTNMEMVIVQSRWPVTAQSRQNPKEFEK